MKKELNKAFWDNRWETGETGWDIGYASPEIAHYFERIKNEKVKILIPGCGNAYEAEALYSIGFQDITVVDISNEAAKRLEEKFENHDEVQVICEDFFQHNGQYDFIIEQTFFCALNPNLRAKYVDKMHELLKSKGTLVGLLFNRTFDREGPPFGGNRIDYVSLFSQKFELKQIDIAKSSIPQRLGNELFIEFIKK